MIESGMVKRMCKPLIQFLIVVFCLLQSFNSAVAQIKSDFLVDQGVFPCVQFDAQGRIHLTWSDTSAYYALWDSTFSSIRAPVRISISQYANTPRLAVSPSGTIVVWSKWNRPITNYLIYSQMISPSGDTILGNVRLDDYGSQQVGPSVTFLDDTTFVSAWHGDGPGGFVTWAQISTTTFRMTHGNILCNDTLSASGGGSTRVVSNLSTGEFLVAWRSGASGRDVVYMRLFNRDGVPLTPVTLASENPAMMDVWFLSATVIANHGFVLVWGSEEDSVWKIKQRRVGFDGKPSSPETLVSQDTLSILDYPSIDISADVTGNYIVVWEQSKGSHSRIFGQRYLPEGTPVGQNFQISNSPDTLGNYAPSVALHNGRIATAWMTYVPLLRGYQVWANLLSFDKPTGMNAGQVPVVHDFQLDQNYPNPFNPSTVIGYHIDESGLVNLSVYNLLGQPVRVLLNEEQAAGTHRAVWDGETDSGIPLPSGVYFCRLSEHDRIQVTKILLIR